MTYHLRADSTSWPDTSCVHQMRRSLLTHHNRLLHVEQTTVHPAHYPHHQPQEAFTP